MAGESLYHISSTGGSEAGREPPPTIPTSNSLPTVQEEGSDHPDFSSREWINARAHEPCASAASPTCSAVPGSAGRRGPRCQRCGRPNQLPDSEPGSSSAGPSTRSAGAACDFRGSRRRRQEPTVNLYLLLRWPEWAAGPGLYYGSWATFKAHVNPRDQKLPAEGFYYRRLGHRQEALPPWRAQGHARSIPEFVLELP